MTTKVPNSMLVSPGGTGGSSAAASVPYSTVIPLDQLGAGSVMQATTLSAASVFSVGAGALEGGSCQFTLLGDGNSAHVPNLSAFSSGDGYTYSYGTGDQNIYVAVWENGSAVVYGSLVGDTGGARPVTHTDAIPLDTPGFGKKANAIVSIATTRTLSIGTSIDGGSYQVVFQAAGGSLTIPAGWKKRGNDAMGVTSGDKTLAVFSKVGTDVVYVLVPLSTSDTIPPALVSISVANATPTVVDFTFGEALEPGHVPLFSDFAISGHTTTGTVTLVGAVAHVSVTVAFTNGETARTGSYTPGLTANKLQDAAGNLVAAIVSQPITNNVAGGGSGTIFEDNLAAPSSGSIGGHTPTVSNAEGLAWSDKTFGNMVFLGGSLAAGELVGPPFAVDGAVYPITSRKNFTLEVTALIATSASPASQMDVYVRDTGASTVATATAYRVRVDPSAGNITVNQITAGVVGSTLATITTAAWASNATAKLGLVMDNSDNMQVQVAGSNVGSPIAITGTSFGVRIAATGKGAVATYFTYAKAA